MLTLPSSVKISPTWVSTVTASAYDETYTYNSMKDLIVFSSRMMTWI